MRIKSFLTALVCGIVTTGLGGTAVAADKYVIDPVHSSIEFTVSHLVVSKVKGSFDDFEGVILYDADNVAKSSVEVTIRSASIDTRHEKRDGHLKSPDFLAVEEYPELTFKSRSVEKSDDGLAVIGMLTIRGVAKEVTIPFDITGIVTDPYGQTRLVFEAGLEINRHDYGVSWNQKLDNGGFLVGDDVEIEIIVEAVLKSA